MTKVQFVGTHVPGVPLRERCVARQQEIIGPFPMVLDPEREGIWPTTRKAWDVALEHATPDTTHIMIIQDDIMPCDTFVENLNAALTAVPDKPVVTYSIRRTVQEAADEVRWALSADNIQQGTAIPIDWVQPFLDWSDVSLLAGYPHDDRRLCAWLIWTEKTPVWMTVPPLFQHVGHAESLVGHSNVTRYSKTWRQDLPVFDWSDTTKPLSGNSVGSWINQVRAHLTPTGVQWLKDHGK